MSPKEQWTTAAEKFRQEDPVEARKKRDEIYDNELQLAIAEMNLFLTGEEGQAALAFLATTRQEVKLASHQEPDDHAVGRILFGQAGFKEVIIVFGEYGEDPPRERLISTKEAVRHTAYYINWRNPEPKIVLPLLRQKLDLAAQKILEKTGIGR